MLPVQGKPAGAAAIVAMAQLGNTRKPLPYFPGTPDHSLRQPYTSVGDRKTARYGDDRP